MPKEITYGDGPEFVIEPDGSELHPVKPEHYPLPVLKRAAVVGWLKDRNGYVEVGIQCLEVGTNANGHHPGQYASFDRQGINRLIRTLRRARDQAFGVDA